MKLFFFGVKDAGQAGHQLYHLDEGVLRYSMTYHTRLLPFRWSALDGSFLPQDEPQIQGRAHHSIINGWSILTMWDRTGDSRGASNAAFVAEGEFNAEAMMVIAKVNFPELFNRIKPHLPTTHPSGLTEGER